MSDTIFATAGSSRDRPAWHALLIRTAVVVISLVVVVGAYALLSRLWPSPADIPAPRHPFGAGLQETAPAPTGIGGAIIAIQSVFYTRMVGALRAFASASSATAGITALWTLAALGFAYGIFHAAGPGHGKAVISGYLVADGRRSLRRGLALAFASSLLQALSAIAIVGVLAVFLDATASAINASARLIEQASFGLVAIVGFVILWRKSGKLLAFFRPPAPPDPFGNLPFQPAETAVSGRFLAQDADAAPAVCDHPSCRTAGCCDHTHLLTPEEVGRLHSFREMAAVTFSAGLRPCTGAIIVLVFALSQRQFAAGIAATLAMALGTFITVGTLACLAVYAKRFAVRLAGTNNRRGVGAVAALEVLASALVAVTGIVLMLGAYQAG
ncbi:nickel/cobalt transporter [Pseudochelatococcus lubricantis]|uniref:nickel/cobalt transporter n=1 Tax=Pseudochelatococcus lubricantis TaxID=1538102 RepID=UPI0035ED1138